MGKSRAQRRAARRRRAKVDRFERVLPPPEAAQHHRPWPMQTLLAAGHPDGIDADEFEAALQIVETFHALTQKLGPKAASIVGEKINAGACDGMSDRDAERIACWFEWSLCLPIGLPSRLVDWIEDELPIGSVEVLRRACRLWDRVRSDRAKAPQPVVTAVDIPPRAVLTICAQVPLRQEIVGTPANLPAQRFSPPSTFPATRPALAPLAASYGHPGQPFVTSTRRR